MLARDLQRDQSLPQQIGVMSPILVGAGRRTSDGEEPGDYIGIAETTYDMMKKFMQVPDGLMKMYFELLTSISMEEFDKIMAGHPKEAKIRLARAVISAINRNKRRTKRCDAA